MRDIGNLSVVFGNTSRTTDRTNGIDNHVLMLVRHIVSRYEIFRLRKLGAVRHRKGGGGGRFLAERNCGSRKCNDEMKKNRVALLLGKGFIVRSNLTTSAW